MAKLARERLVQERRERKREKKAARHEAAQAGDVQPAEEPSPPDTSEEPI